VTVPDFPTNGSDVATLSPTTQANLAQVVTFMTAEPALVADVIGHADNTGPASVNATVSRARAEAVKRHLVRMGIAPGRFRAILGKGSSECPVPGADPKCRKAEVFMFLFEAASETSRV